ncbi:MAG: PA14 domain-containing protein [bacterium]
MKKRNKKNSQSLIKTAYAFGPFNLAAVSLLLALIGQYMLFVNKWLAPGLVMFALALVVFILADKSSRNEVQEDILDVRIEALAFLGIMLVAIFFRLFLIDQLPSGCFRDEGQNGNEAINIMNGVQLEGTKLPVYIARDTENAAMYMYYIAAFFKFFGIGVMQIRAVSIVIGLLCVPAFYFLVRYLMGPKMAIVGGFLIAVTSWHVNFSRIGFLGIATVFFAILCFYFAWKTYVKRRPFDFIMLGILTALALYTYIAGRLIPVALVIFCGYIFIVEMKFYVKNYKNIILGLAAFLIVISPMLNYVIRNPQKFMSRTATVSIFNQDMLTVIGGRYMEKDKSTGNMKNKSWEKLYLESFANTMLMFNYLGDANVRHNVANEPMLDFVTGIFMLLGLGYALVNIYKPRYFLLLAMYFSFMQAGLFSIESPQAYRTIAEIPMVLLFAVITIWKVLEFSKEQHGKDFTKTVMIAGMIILGYVAYANYDRYFVMFKNHAGSWAEFSTDEYSLGRYVHDLGPDTMALVRPAWLNSYTYKFAVYPHNNYTHFSLSEHVPIKSELKSNYAYVLDESFLPLLPILKKMYPEGKYSEFRHKFVKHQILYFTYEVPYESIKAYQEKGKNSGLTGYYYHGIEWNGELLIKRLDPFIFFNWTENPVTAPFSVKWTGKFKAEKSGQYTFITKSNDYSDLTIDGKQVLKNPGAEIVKDAIGKGSVYLAAGKHSITLRYYESINHSEMQFYWNNPKTGEEEVVPSEVLTPQ